VQTERGWANIFCTLNPLVPQEGTPILLFESSCTPPARARHIIFPSLLHCLDDLFQFRRLSLSELFRGVQDFVYIKLNTPRVMKLRKEESYDVAKANELEVQTASAIDLRKSSKMRGFYTLKLCVLEMSFCLC